MRAVTADDWELWRDLRYRALGTDPDAFGSTLAREQALTEADWRHRVGRGGSYVAWVGGRPVGSPPVGRRPVGGRPLRGRRGRGTGMTATTRPGTAAPAGTTTPLAGIRKIAARRMVEAWAVPCSTSPSRWT